METHARWGKAHHQRRGGSDPTGVGQQSTGHTPVYGIRGTARSTGHTPVYGIRGTARGGHNDAPVYGIRGTARGGHNEHSLRADGWLSHRSPHRLGCGCQRRASGPGRPGEAGVGENIPHCVRDADRSPRHGVGVLEVHRWQTFGGHLRGHGCDPPLGLCVQNRGAGRLGDVPP